MSCNIASMTGIRGKLVVLLAALATFGSCKSSTLTKGRCDKASDCVGGLTCDSLRTCVPTTLSAAPCANDAQCGSDYACDNLQWCVCQVPNSNLSSNDDPCANGTLPPYRGTTTDGGPVDGQGATDAHDAGQICQPGNSCSGGVCSDAGVCVGCNSDNDCTVLTKPICDPTSKTCVACATDAQCVTKFAVSGTANPGVCMFQMDGHCATDTETVYVESTIGCLSSTMAGGGSASLPFCSLGPAVPSLDIRDLIVVRGAIAGSSSIGMGSISIVGQESAKITPATGMPGIQVSAATVYIRGIRITGGDNVGISAAAGAMLTLDSVRVDACVGGGLLLDGAAFDLENTTVTGNGPASSGAVTWGGIFVNNPPAGGTTKLNLLTVENNMAPGVSCSTSIAAMVSGVLASGNSTTDINPTCGFSSCGSLGPTCGAP